MFWVEQIFSIFFLLIIFWL